MGFDRTCDFPLPRAGEGEGKGKPARTTLTSYPLPPKEGEEVMGS